MLAGGPAVVIDAGAALAQESAEPGGDARAAVLWFRSPARTSSEALAIGNGRLGALVFGQPASERIELFEQTLWDGGPRDRVNPKSRVALPEVRRLLFDGRLDEAERLAEEALAGPAAPLGSPQPFGELRIDVEGAAPVAEYRRELDVRDGVAQARWRSGDAAFDCEVFASAPDAVLVVRLRAERGSFSARVRAGRSRDVECDLLGPDRIALRGRLRGTGDSPGAGEGLQFEAQVLARKVGGSFASEPGGAGAAAVGAAGAARGGPALVARDVLALELLVSMRTSFRGSDPSAACAKDLEAAAARPFDELRRRNDVDRRDLMDRFSIGLGEPQDAALRRALPTDERLAALKQGGDDLDLVATHVELARHLLLSCSRPGGLPATRCGLWSDGVEGAAGGGYLLDSALPLAYAPVEALHLSECREPLLDWIERLIPSGRDTARRMYGRRGFVAHRVSDAWGTTAPAGGLEGLWPMGGACLALQAHERWAFRRDESELRARIWPILREAVLFLLDFLVEAPDGRLVACPSRSPGGPFLIEGRPHSLTHGATTDLAIARELLARSLEVARRVGAEEELRFALEDALHRLAPLPISLRTGRLQEWLEEREPAEPGHPHFSQLFALFPGRGIAPRATPDLAAAARSALEQRVAQGGGSTAWSRAWAAALFARLEDGRAASGQLHELLARSTLPNLLSGSPRAGIDGNLAGAAAVVEMLLHSHAREVSLLPALPPRWESGAVRGLLARGAVEVDLAWSRGRLDSARLLPKVAGAIRLRTPRRVVVRREGRSTPLPVDRIEKGLLEFAAEAGAVYLATAADE